VAAATWLASPPGALLVIFFVLAGLAHALVGLRSVFFDYVHTRASLFVANLLVRAAVAILAGASVLAVLKLFLGH
jgi:succinate dehydrogenase / fumarate reductase membrane anchor subunit